MKKLVMLIVVILGTSFANANIIPLKSNVSKEVKASLVRKHKTSKKAKTAKTRIAKPVTQTAKK